MAEVPLYLAPLAGYTDQAFRRLCKDWQADYLVSEMVSADGIVRNQPNTMCYAEFSEYERPFFIQIFGFDPLIMAKAAEKLLPLKPDFIDINMGCPVKKVVKRGSGSALMKDPQRASIMVKEVKGAISGACKLSVKFRSGWDMNSLNFLDFGLKMEESGADLICLHSRTTSQMFSGKSNWEHIRILKEKLSVPLIGNGDIDSPESAKAMLDQTGCDGLMIGRGALGKPWLFAQIKEYLKTGAYSPATRQMILDGANTHINYALEYKNELKVVREMRSQLSHYAKGIPGSKNFRERLNRCESADEIRKLLSSWLIF
ncbi:MAG: tRNA dihydrouridine synthase DusB [Candidatus Cloacimonadaceae bacterium]